VFVGEAPRGSLKAEHHFTYAGRDTAPRSALDTPLVKCHLTDMTISKTLIGDG